MAIVSRANSPPNGIGFKPSRGNPTGRFTNGRTIADIVGEKLGQPNYAVPYLAPNASGDVLLNGVNCALCSGGIHSAAGSVFGPNGNRGIGNISKTEFKCGTVQVWFVRFVGLVRI
ncbi:hypothetical protein IGI04_012410 [Brassica rapa subsp. trilocularis]|uniref:Uncharacterized protein n=2 Tax=Brassica campestris TaxID=3711 RepID=M4D8U2_BRACM|nr:hypothetical protein IGI04_012410 [Brassica rapa subsp. trilocularis]